MYEKILYQIPSAAGESFRPSNGTEGMIFMCAFCEQCIHEKFTHTQNDDDKKCDILTATMLYDFNDKDYPSEWRYDDEGWPHCSEYKHWDWGSDDDFNDPGPDDLPPPPPDPNQLNLFPLYPDERNYEPNKTLPSHIKAV